MATQARRVGRKLLIASIGVATVSYVGCGSSTTASKNDGAADAAQMDAGAAGSDGRDAAIDSGPDGADAAMDRQFTGNIVAP
jgi:hypothetical protein